MAARDPPKPKIDRQSTTPFHLKLFYRSNNYHNISDFSIPPSFSSSYNGPVSGSNAIRSRSPPPPAPLPAHLQIYTWQSCTLRELSQLLTSALPSMLPDPPIGTRLCFRLIYPDTKAAAMMGGDARGRYLSKDLGSVVIGPRESPYRDSKDEEASNDTPASFRTGPFRLQGNDAEKTLQEARFVIGDYVDCAILPPLEDGSVAPPLSAPRGHASGGGGGMRAFRDPGFGGGGPGGRPGRGRGGAVIPSGDWRRGERIPEGGRGFGGAPGRRGWAPY
ncbi:Sin3 associated polypeptide p18-domain-containing protein [Aspergillus cavernicola]|uniref:Sin3 associated polypeptide p18-domain-containing protein n=1 Tax=Aspergillus cavernicola TaxID=176166 RepID=A0ABR4IIL2_9EURO